MKGTHGRSGSTRAAIRPVRIRAKPSPRARRPGPHAKVSLPDVGTDPDRVLLASLRVRVREEIWTGSFSRRHPKECVEILNHHVVTTDVSVSDHWISGQPPGVWGREIAAYPDVVNVDCLAEVGEGSLYRIIFRNPPVVYLYRRLRLPFPLPLRIQDGFIRWEVVARARDFRRILNFARQADPAAQVVSLRSHPLRDHHPLLSEIQRTLLSEAMAAGYFAVPRRISLTDLARQLERSKSSVSEAMAQIERKLLESALRPDSFAP